MSAWLLEISIGPVQGFIAAARRSRDLWAGSYLLSELVRAAASELLRQRAKLIYPLASRVQAENPEEDSNLSNILLACIETTDEAAVRAIAGTVRQAARQRLARFAEEARADWQRAGVELRRGFWQRQIDDALETYAAWARIPDLAQAGKPPYRVAYEGLKRSLAARKNTRDFAPMFPDEAAEQGAGIPKCSFDGLRESVLPDLPVGQRFPACFGLGRGEQLDALGCLKRVVGRRERFAALSRFAADGWLRRLDEAACRALAKAHEPLVNEKIGLATRAPGTAAALFAYDGGLLFPERYAIAQQDSQDNPAAQAALEALGTLLRPLWKRHGRPCPYGVLLIADGDRMGRFVDRARQAAEHQHISAAVADFADRVPAIARQFGGQCVFAGGEDVMLLLPLAAVVEGAFALHGAFDAALAGVVRELVGDRQDARPTLRVGAAICHVLEPLGVIRQRAVAAEQFAKGAAGSARQGNALGLRLHIRSGQDIGLRLRFDDAPGRQALADWRQAYENGRLPGRMAYDTRAIALGARASGASPGVAEAEFRRLLERARQSGGVARIDDALRAQLGQRRALLAAAADHAGDAAGLLRLADELIVARWLSARSEADLAATQGAR